MGRDRVIRGTKGCLSNRVIMKVRMVKVRMVKVRMVKVRMMMIK